MLIECRNCGKEILTNKGAKKYCNEECREKYLKWLKANSKYKCEFCGEIFISGRKRKYCTNNCRLKANGQRKESRIVSQKKDKKESPKYSLAEVTKIATEIGLTYGQCVARLGL